MADAAGGGMLRRRDGLVERLDYVPSRDGAMPVFAVRPEPADRSPIVLIHMDAVGFRHELQEFARRIARAGFYAVLPNLYYRWGGTAFDTWDPERSLIWFRPMSYGLTPDMIQYDAALAIAHASADPAASPGPAGCIGFCMGGRMALMTAGTQPDRIGAAVSLYGGRQVTARPDSPHRLAMRAKAGFFIGFAEQDHVVTARDRETLEADFRAAGMDYEAELFPGAAHGFSFPERNCYHHDAAERAWAKAIGLFRRRLH